MPNREERVEMSKKVRYVHYRATHGGVVTIATARDPRDPCRSFFGFSYCSPKDQFRKYYGRQQSFRRLMEGLQRPHIICSWLHTDSNPTVVSYLTETLEAPEKPYVRSLKALSSVLQKNFAPAWLKEVE
jgi:hypothetical protein